MHPLAKNPINYTYDAIASQNKVITSFVKSKALGRHPYKHALCTDNVEIFSA
jgi:hypothetical protein